MKKEYIDAKELSQLLGIPKSRAYRIIRQLNDELDEKGFIVIAEEFQRNILNKVGIVEIKIG